MRTSAGVRFVTGAFRFVPAIAVSTLAILVARDGFSLLALLAAAWPFYLAGASSASGRVPCSALQLVRQRGAALAGHLFLGALAGSGLALLGALAIGRLTVGGDLTAPRLALGSGAVVVAVLFAAVRLWPSAPLLVSFEPPFDDWLGPRHRGQGNAIVLAVRRAWLITARPADRWRFGLPALVLGALLAATVLWLSGGHDAGVPSNAWFAGMLAYLFVVAPLTTFGLVELCGRLAARAPRQPAPPPG